MNRNIYKIMSKKYCDLYHEWAHQRSSGLHLGVRKLKIHIYKWIQKSLPIMYPSFFVDYENAIIAPLKIPGNKKFDFQIQNMMSP